MEKRRFFVGFGRARVWLESLSRQNRADFACDLGCLGAAHGDHLFVALSPAISALQSGPYFLGIAPDLHDQPLRWKNRSRRAAGAFRCDRGSSADYGTVMPSQIFWDRINRGFVRWGSVPLSGIGLILSSSFSENQRKSADK